MEFWEFFDLGSMTLNCKLPFILYLVISAASLTLLSFSFLLDLLKNVITKAFIY